MGPLVVVLAMARHYSQPLTDSPVSAFGQSPGGPGGEAMTRRGLLGFREEGYVSTAMKPDIAWGGISVSSGL